ncbi:MAG: hypothetical protein ACRDJH_00110 [Thermomicrobiales bacterium]
MDNPFSWDYLTTRPGSNEVFGAFAILFLVIFGVGFLASLVNYSGWVPRSVFPNPVLRRMAHHWSVIGLFVFGIGLFFFLIRMLQINPFTFGLRIWLWLSFVAFLLFAVYVVFDLLTRYHGEVAAFEKRRQQQHYLRPSGATAGGRVEGPGAPLASGARPVKRRKR